MPSWTDQLADALADRYRLERELGQGGMAVVYLAQPSVVGLLDSGEAGRTLFYVIGDSLRATHGREGGVGGE